ncbi:Uncharacterized protein, contains ferredoxin domain [Thermanaeromonas toyohensis ToBE]|uniref:Uncharacterized protein, contains ferredoxin domain n=1 Tax=Thermanaeromonas toyohensis ToBE TaxID=698762 RepID=A0A1W1VQB1_9FIRM|nr:DUF2148 domain-containing protein [Thermanaeromonas toyohensis]SMB95410.1 Uncharacterized protein, contains ferredoxin domain [Thermanaeromonas toyohensis ToBE]
MSNILRTAAELMALAARTAPKAAGKDFVVLEILEGEQLNKLADAMVEYGRQTGRKNFDRDGENVRRSAAVLLIGLKNPQKTGLDCGACGAPRCAELGEVQEGPEFAGPLCVWRLLDLGIAIGSAVKTASILNVDNRIMYRIGVLARRLKFIDAEVVIGVPLSATGKNIYFDRPS